jgi:hypothetical protein
MDDKVLKISADARQLEQETKKAGHDIDEFTRRIDKLIRVIDTLNTKGGKGIVSGLRQIKNSLPNQTEGGLAGIGAAIGDYERRFIPTPAVRAGVPGSNGTAPPSKGNGSGRGGAFGGGVKGFFERRIIGNLVSMGMGMGIYGTAQFVASSAEEASNERAADARMKHQLSRTGRLGMMAGIQQQALAINKTTGKNVGDIETLISRAALGTGDLKNATRAAKLGMDIEAGGGGIGADTFIKAFNSGGAEFMDRMKELARAEGIQIDQTTTINDVLAKLEERFGGLSEKVYEAQGGISKLSREWERIKVAVGNKVEPAAGYVADALEGKHPMWEQLINNFLAPNQYALPNYSNISLVGRGSSEAPVADTNHLMNKPSSRMLRPAKAEPQGTVVHRTEITFRNDPSNASQLKARGI